MKMGLSSNVFSRKLFRYSHRNLATANQPPVPTDPPESWQLRFLKYGCITMGTILSLYLFTSACKYQYLKGKESAVIVDDSVNIRSSSK